VLQNLPIRGVLLYKYLEKNPSSEDNYVSYQT